MNFDFDPHSRLPLIIISSVVVGVAIALLVARALGW